MGNSFSKMKKQAKQLQEQLGHMQKELESLRVSGVAGNGLVSVTMSGEKEITDITIKPECVDPEDVEGLQDLILEAIKKAHMQLQQQTPALPGLGSLPFGL